jgi:hypothetical protein
LNHFSCRELNDELYFSCRELNDVLYCTVLYFSCRALHDVLQLHTLKTARVCKLSFYCGIDPIECFISIINLNLQFYFNKSHQTVKMSCYQIIQRTACMCKMRRSELKTTMCALTIGCLHYSNLITSALVFILL